MVENVVMELTNSRVELKLPSPTKAEISRKKRSTLFIQELEVGMK